MSLEVKMVISEIINWKETDIIYKHAKMWQTDHSKRRGVYERCSLEAGVCWKHLHHEPHRKLAADYYFPYLPFPPGKLTSADLPVYTLLHPQSCYTLRIHKTNKLLGWYGPSHGPPSLARHGGGTSDSVSTHWFRQSYEILYSTKLNIEGDQVEEQQLSIPSPGGGTWKLVQA